MDEVMLSNSQINEIFEISKSIVDENLEFKRLSQTSDSEVNKDKYQNIIKPKITEYKNKFGGTPNITIKKFLKQYLHNNNLEDTFEVKSYPYYGQKVYPYVWGAITKKDENITDRKDSHYPQLYLLVSNFGITFGFCYGFQVKDKDQFVTSVKESFELKNEILQIQKQGLHVFKGLVHEKEYDEHEQIAFTNVEDVGKLWSHELDLINYYKTHELPEDISLHITDTYDKLLSFFLRLHGVDSPNNTKPSFEKMNILLKKKQIIAYGPPGTGKTYHTKRKSVENIMNGGVTMNNLEQEYIDQQFGELKEKGHIEFITFHPSYSYEEFVEGITIDIDSTGKPTENLSYKLKQGLFKQMVMRSLSEAIDEQDSNVSLEYLIKKYREQMSSVTSEIEDLKEKRELIKKWWEDKPRFVLIIDEINRGDISKVFGELITLLEADKRLGMENELTVKLPYSQEEFAIPPNLYVIGTMNTADKSIALIDVALRRRFGFMEMSPDFGVLQKEHLEKNSEALKNEEVYDGLEKSIVALEIINNRIAADPSVGRDRQIGHSFLFKVQTQSDLILVWKNEILPLLEEYYYGQYSRINELLFQKADDTSWLSQNEGIKDFAEYEDLNAFLDEVNSNE